MFRTIIAACLLAGPALAAGDPPAPAATTVAPAVAQANPEDKQICKVETPTGSRLGGHKVCMKKSDWDAEAQASQRQRVFAPPAGISGQH